MRGTPSISSTEQSATQIAGDGRPAVVESRSTYTPVFAPAVTGRVYGGGTGSDGVFANLSAKPERGEKVDEHPPVCTSCTVPWTHTNGISDIRASRSRRSTTILGNEYSRAGLNWR